MISIKQVGNQIIKEPSWEKFLLEHQPRNNFKEYYQKRLAKNENEYWQILAEAETAYLFHFKFKIPIIDFERITIKGKNVDLVAKHNDSEIYIEVTTSQYKPEKNTDTQQDAKLKRALGHGSKKFLENQRNFVVYYDEQLYPLFYDPYFMNDSVPDNYFNLPILDCDNGKVVDLKKISALLLFGGRQPFDENKRCAKVWRNPNAHVDLGLSEKDIKIIEGGKNYELI